MSFFWSVIINKNKKYILIIVRNDTIFNKRKFPDVKSEFLNLWEGCEM